MKLTATYNTMDINTSEVSNNIIKPFLEWCYYQAFDLSKKSIASKVKEATGVTTGIVLGVASVASIYPLGGDFGEVLSDYLEIHDPRTRQLLYHFFATSGIIPMIALSCVEAQDLFRKMATPQYNGQLITHHYPRIRKGIVTLAYLFAAFSALSPMYATIEAFTNSPLWLKIAIIPASYVGPFIFKSASEIRMIDRIFSSLSPSEKEAIQLRRRQILTTLRATKKAINQLTNNELDSLFLAIFDKNNDLVSTENPTSRSTENIHRLLAQAPLDSDVENQNIFPVEKKCNLGYFSKSFAKGLGLTIGAASSYVYYTLAESASNYICDYLNIEDPTTRAALRTISGCMAIVPWCSLGAEATYTVFDKIHQSVSSLCVTQNDGIKTPFRKKIISAVSAVGGLCASTAPTYLAYQALEMSPAYWKVLIIPAFIGPASIRSVALSRVLNETIEWIANLKPDNHHMKKEKLMRCVENIMATIDKLPENQLLAFYDEFIKHKSHLLTEIDERPVNSRKVVDEHASLITHRY